MEEGVKIGGGMAGSGRKKNGEACGGGPKYIGYVYKIVK